MKNELWTLLAARRPTGIPEDPPLPIDGLNGILGLICSVCQLSSSFPVLTDSIPYVFSRGDRWGAVRRMDWVVQPPGW